MRPEKEAETSLNDLFHSIYGGGTDQLLVRLVSRYSYRITLQSNSASKLISGDQVDHYIDGTMRESNHAKQALLEILEQLQQQLQG